jgi:hypothetical protein
MDRKRYNMHTRVYTFSDGSGQGFCIVAAGITQPGRTEPPILLAESLSIEVHGSHGGLFVRSIWTCPSCGPVFQIDSYQFPLIMRSLSSLDNGAFPDATAVEAF